MTELQDYEIHERRTDKGSDRPEELTGRKTLDVDLSQ